MLFFKLLQNLCPNPTFHLFFNYSITFSNCRQYTSKSKHENIGNSISSQEKFSNSNLKKKIKVGKNSYLHSQDRKQFC